MSLSGICSYPKFCLFSECSGWRRYFMLLTEILTHWRQNGKNRKSLIFWKKTLSYVNKRVQIFIQFYGVNLEILHVGPTCKKWCELYVEFKRFNLESESVQASRDDINFSHTQSHHIAHKSHSTHTHTDTHHEQAQASIHSVPPWQPILFCSGG